MIRPSRRLAEIARRKEQLSIRADAQRAAIAAALHHLRVPLRVVDRGLGVVSLLRAHPLLFGAGVAAIVALARRRLLVLGIAAWRICSSVAGWPSVGRGERLP